MSEYITKDWLSVELQKVHSVIVYINSSVSGVVASKVLMAKPSFTLILSHHFDRPIIFRKEDMKSDFLLENGFESCTIPWNSIWAAHPENETEKICFWNENSPGKDWDKALRDYLGLKDTSVKLVPGQLAPDRIASDSLTSDSVALDNGTPLASEGEVNTKAKEAKVPLAILSKSSAKDAPLKKVSSDSQAQGSDSANNILNDTSETTKIKSKSRAHLKLVK